MPAKTEERRARYAAHEEEGAPGMGRRPDAAGERLMAVAVTVTVTTEQSRAAQGRGPSWWIKAAMVLV